MKQTLTLALIMLMAVSGAFAKDKRSTAKGANITVTYGQPSKKGRLIFGEKKDGAVVPYGEVWSAGTDEGTEITIDKASLFANRQLSAGTYTMYVVPAKAEWLIILNKNLKQVGAANYTKIKGDNIIESAVSVGATTSPVETFTITVKTDGFQMEWENTSVWIPVKPF